MNLIPLATFALGGIFSILLILWVFERDDNRSRAGKPFFPRPPRLPRYLRLTLLPSWLWSLRPQRRTHDWMCGCSACRLNRLATTSIDEVIDDILGKDNLFPIGANPFPSAWNKKCPVGRDCWYCNPHLARLHKLFYPNCEAFWSHKHSLA